MDFGTIGAYGVLGNKEISGARRKVAAKTNKEMKEAGFELRKIPKKKCPYSEMASETVEEAAERNAETESDTEPEYSEESTIAYINSFRTELYYKLINNETETKYRIGSQELTLKEWDKMISDFDEKQEYVREAMREEVEGRMTDEEQEEMIRKLFEDRVQ